MLPLPYAPALCLPWPTIQPVALVLVLVFIVVLVALGSDPALALGVALAAMTATIGQLNPADNNGGR
ncbi:hypothetical protein ABZ897_60015 [Nonomuraea sp. NPDC046802]|uniref:hypothetical protein n=1 Tax=Nonomuraea sp. NPDC046802 TaxID=3154919 RepID=UPI0033C7FA48